MLWKTTRVGPDSDAELWEVANAVTKSINIIVVTGAGISTSAGIPDFRSETGLYSHRRCGGSVKDLFHIRSLSHPLDGPRLLRRLASDLQLAERCQPTELHRFLAGLSQEHRLARCYTQNIDGLEEKVGLCTDLQRGPGDRPREGKASWIKCQARGNSFWWQSGVECVQLHGSLFWFRCLKCAGRCGWDEDTQAAMQSGVMPHCPMCAEICKSRLEAKKRYYSIGLLHPDIILYGDYHPYSDLITETIQHDLSLDIDLLLILGTSLSIPGVEKLVDNLACVVHEHGGKVIFINLTKPAARWDRVFDYWVEWECDSWVKDFQNRTYIRPFSSFRL